MEFDLQKPDIESLLIDLELPVYGLHNQLEQLLNTIQEDCLIKDKNAYNTICGQLSISIAGAEYIQKICQEQYKELNDYFEQASKGTSDNDENLKRLQDDFI